MSQEYEEYGEFEPGSVIESNIKPDAPTYIMPDSKPDDSNPDDSKTAKGRKQSLPHSSSSFFPLEKLSMPMEAKTTSPDIRLRKSPGFVSVIASDSSVSVRKDHWVAYLAKKSISQEQTAIVLYLEGMAKKDGENTATSFIECYELDSATAKIKKSVITDLTQIERNMLSPHAIIEVEQAKRLQKNLDNADPRSTTEKSRGAFSEKTVAIKQKWFQDQLAQVGVTQDKMPSIPNHSDEQPNNSCSTCIIL
jgi:hypothetical protein